MDRCPKCGYKLKITDLKPECPGCGVNLMYYDMQLRLETTQSRRLKRTP